MHIYFTINTVTEMICFLMGIIFLFRDKDFGWRLLCLYLLLVCAVEIGGIHLWKVLSKPNYMVYNLLLIFENLMVSYFLFYLIKPYKNRLSWLIVWQGLFLVCFVVEMTDNQLGGFAFRTVIVMSVAFVVASLYFYYLMLSDDQFIQLWKHAPFWWVNGVLFFYFGSTACNVLFKYFLLDNTHLTASIRYWIFAVLNIILYTCWSYAFICRYRLRLLP